jgi:hypothetical protein
VWKLPPEAEQNWWQPACLGQRWSSVHCPWARCALARSWLRVRWTLTHQTCQKAVVMNLWLEVCVLSLNHYHWNTAIVKTWYSSPPVPTLVKGAVEDALIIEPVDQVVHFEVPSVNLVPWNEVRLQATTPNLQGNATNELAFFQTSTKKSKYFLCALQ